MFSFKSAGHAFATFLKAVVKDVKTNEPKVESALEKAEGTKTEVELITAGVLGAINPGAALPAVSIENAAYAVLGEVVALLHAGDKAAAAKLVDAGLDKNVVEAAQAVAAGSKQVGTLVAAAAK